MKKNRVRRLLALGLSLTKKVSIMGCGKQQRLDAEINPDTPVSDVQFPLKETEELSFITSAPATSTQDPNKRVIFQRMEEQTNVHIDWTCFVSDQFSDKKNLAEVIVAKQRNGATGSVELVWLGQYTKFANKERVM